MPKKHLDYAVTAFTMLKMFRLEHEVHWLLGGQVNCLSNVLSFHVELHRAFHRFALWLEAIPGQVRSTLFSLLHDHSIKSDRNIHMMWIWLKGNNLHYHWVDPRLPLMINPDCAALCREHGSTPLPKLPNPDLIAIRAIFAQVANICIRCCGTNWLNSLRWKKSIPRFWRMVGAQEIFLTSLLNTRHHYWCIVQLFRSFLSGSTTCLYVATRLWRWVAWVNCSTLIIWIQTGSQQLPASNPDSSIKVPPSTPLYLTQWIEPWRLVRV